MDVHLSPPRIPTSPVHRRTKSQKELFPNEDDPTPGGCCRLLSPFALSFQPAPAPAQDGEGLQPGEAYSTRFSGTTTGKNQDGEDVTVLDTKGIVGSAIDLREPGGPPKGEHWLTEPQRLPLTAAEVGQVFGIAMDDAEPPNLFIAATAAFGLHRSPDGAGWMAGMWGPDGGPGTVYKLSAENGYAPEVFANITLDGRENSGPSLGNIAYDPTHKQLYVSDLETGMIYRLNAETGEVLGHFDHGIDGRSTFIDAETNDYATLPVIEFDPSSEANLEGCETDFSTTPECWNIADYRRRVWGLGVFEDPDSGTMRLFYAVWSSDPLGAQDWDDAGEDQRNSLWSVAITEDGDFDIDQVRREFLLPAFGVEGAPDVQAAVSDIAFSKDGTMLIAERGGMRNLGLGEIQAFARPYTSRILQYKRRAGGAWTPIARFDVGFYDRLNDGEPYLRASASGGVDYGFGYTADGVLDPNQRQRFVWAAGDYLCSPEGPCNDPDEGPQTDEDQVHGLQGTPRKYDSKLLPDGAVAEYPQNGVPYPPRGPDNSYLIDLDLNIDGFGRIIEEEAQRDDSGQGGDIEVVQGAGQTLPPPPQHAKQLSAFHNKYDSNRHDRSRSLPVHTKDRSHSRQGSHDREISHYRTSSHDLRRSHYRYGSHNRVDSHYRIWSHNRRSSHRKYGSHTRFKSHGRLGSHNLRKSHFKLFSHYRPKSHFKGLSRLHVRKWSHYRPQSHNKSLSGGHVRPWSHYRPNSHRRSVSGLHIKPWSHYRPRSHARARSRLHVKPFSHFRPQSRVGPLNCTGGRIAQGNRCVCPPNRPFWNGQRCRRRAQQPAQCTGGRVLQGNQCVCPARRPNWNGQRCVRRAQPAQCTGGRVLRNNQCVCPARRPNWNGQRCVRRAQPVQCTGGRVLQGNQCVCPPNRPRWDGNRCRRRGQQPAQCTGGRILQGNQCVCPPNRPRWDGNRCRRRGQQQPQQCTGGRVLQGNQCVCPPNRPRWDGNRCRRPRQQQPQQCSGGRVLQGNQCVCPQNRPRWDGNRCRRARQQQPQQCSGGRVRQGNQCVCPQNRPRWDGNKCRKARQQQPQRCSGGRVRQGNQCVCPQNRPRWDGNKCRKARQQQPQRCSGGRVRQGNQCVCPPNRPRWDGNKCRKARQQQPQRCSGGRVRQGNQCVCPPNRPRWDGNRCLRRAQQQNN